VLERHFHRRLEHAAGGIADNDVEPVEMLADLGKHVRHTLGNANASLHRVRGPPHRPQLHAQGFGLVVAVVVIHRHVRAGRRQLARNGATDTARSARDKRDFSGERT
jgi:hypothetical protein